MNYLLLAVILVACLPLAAVAALLADVEISLRGLQIPRVTDF